jgi:MFS transporter, OPA family, glycerol-3-phosphate transporter
MLSRLLALYKPAPFIEKLPESEIPGNYRHYRFQMMLSIFIGYAGYYITRSNFSIAKPHLIKEMGLSMGDVGLIGSMMMMAYGISKFVMGNVSDRSNPRYFLGTGLILSGIVNLFFGFLPSVFFMAVFWFANGWFQGMGWAPCARIMTHWFSDRERGTKMAIWNTAHNVGGVLAPGLATMALVIFCTWKSMFYFPAIIVIGIGIFVIAFLRDTPQSVGLPSIEEHMNDYPHVEVDDRERELSAKETLLKFVLNNKFLWILALANVMVYIVRYGVLNWAPTYLSEVKGYGTINMAIQPMLFELTGIPGMLLTGWASDRFFRGRRSPVMVLCMVVVTGAILLYWLNPKDHYWLDSLSLALIGFLIYGPVMLIGVAAVDLVPKKAAGTAGGFTGLFGYIGGIIAEAGIGSIVQHYGWNVGFIIIIAAALISVILLAFTWNVHDRGSEEHKET